MPIDPRVTQKTRRSRSHPNLFQFDYLHIRHLVDDLKTAIETQLKGSALNILDVSCGSKPYEEFFSPYAGLYVGTDIRNHHYGLTDSISQTEFLPFKDNAFDVVISTQALHYFPHPERALSEMERVLKRSGQLIISIPGIWFYSPEVYEHRWTRPGLDRLFERFQHRKIVENGGIVTVIHHADQWLCLDSSRGYDKTLRSSGKNRLPAVPSTVLCCKYMGISCREADRPHMARDIHPLDELSRLGPKQQA